MAEVVNWPVETDSCDIHLSSKSIVINFEISKKFYATNYKITF